MSESVRPDRSPAEPTEREWLEGLREEDRDASAVSEPEPTGAQSTQTVDVRGSEALVLINDLIAYSGLRTKVRLREDLSEYVEAERLLARADALSQRPINPASGHELGCPAGSQDMLGNRGRPCICSPYLAVSEGPAEASVADSANTAETREDRDPFADDVLRRLVKANQDYQRTHGHYIVPLAQRLLDARKDLERLRDEREIGPTPHRCLNDDCGTIEYGTGYEACPGCGGSEGRADV